jgi:hypothetical protein
LAEWQQSSSPTTTAIQTGFFDDVASFAQDAVILAVADCWAPARDLKGKLVIDTTNSIKKDAAMPPPCGVIEYFSVDAVSAG